MQTTTIDTSTSQSRGGAGFSDAVMVNPMPMLPEAAQTNNVENQFHNQYVIARESPVKPSFKKTKAQVAKPDLRSLVDGP